MKALVEHLAEEAADGISVARPLLGSERAVGWGSAREFFRPAMELSPGDGGG